jgi:alpha-tubulin suppressor-like RCC1 family protein
MDSDSAAGRLVTGLGCRGLTLIVAGMFAALSMASAAPAHAARNTAKAWGYNGEGQLGDGTSEGPELCGSRHEEPCSATPVDVSSLVGVTALAAGSSLSLALLEGGTVMAWGDNSGGQLGDGTTVGRNVPGAVTGLSEGAAVSAGANHGLALLKDGTVMAWGRNGQGQLGDGTTSGPEECESAPCSTKPVQVSGLKEVAAISSDGGTNLALLRNGTVMAWGNNASGQLGDGSTTNRDVPVEVSGLKEVAAISSGGSHSLALLKDGTVMAWGDNSDGQLGDGETAASHVPVKVCAVAPAGPCPTGPYLSSITAIAAASTHNLALLEARTAVAWGENSAGQLGDGEINGPETCGELIESAACSTRPVAVSGLSRVAALRAGDKFSLALLADETVRSWGVNNQAQLGDGTTTGPEPCRDGFCSFKPVEVSNLVGVKGLSAGFEHSLAFGAPPAVTKLSPKLGPASGETYVGITGTDFTRATGVKFGSASGTNIEVISPTFMFAKTPAGMTAGIVDVTVTNAWGTSATSSADLYKIKPTITALSATAGPAAGGTSVKVTGSGFATGTTATKFRFGTKRATSVNCSSTTSCTVVAPAHEAGTVDVRAIVAKQSSLRNRPADQFTYS